MKTNRPADKPETGNSQTSENCPSTSYALIDARLVEDTHFLTRFVEPPRLKRPEPVVAHGQMYGTVIREAPGE